MRETLPTSWNQRTLAAFAGCVFSRHIGSLQNFVPRRHYFRGVRCEKYGRVSIVQTRAEDVENRLFIIQITSTWRPSASIGAAETIETRVSKNMEAKIMLNLMCISTKQELIKALGMS